LCGSPSCRQGTANRALDCRQTTTHGLANQSQMNKRIISTVSSPFVDIGGNISTTMVNIPQRSGCICFHIPVANAPRTPFSNPPGSSPILCVCRGSSCHTHTQTVSPSYTSHNIDCYLGKLPARMTIFLRGFVKSLNGGSEATDGYTHPKQIPLSKILMMIIKSVMVHSIVLTFWDTHTHLQTLWNTTDLATVGEWE
jgi:hypothetical protein